MCITICIKGLILYTQYFVTKKNVFIFVCLGRDVSFIKYVYTDDWSFQSELISIGKKIIFT